MKWGPLKDIPADLIEKSRDAMKFEDNKYQAFFQKAMKIRMDFIFHIRREKTAHCF